MFSTKKPLVASRPGLMAMLSLLAIVALSLPASAQKVNITNLTSDISSAGAFQDANLLNPWGMSISPSGPWWLSDNTSGLSTLYIASGQPQGLVVTIPPASGSGPGSPSGTVYNASTTSFKIHNQATPFLFCTEDGTISGWYAGTTAFIAVNNGSNGAVYKGMALASANGINYLYVANFNAGTIDVFDGSYNPFSFGSGSFVDSTLPTGYAPFNIQLVGSSLVVTYAKQDSAKHDDVPGPGNGYVDIYDTQGNLQLRLAHTLYLNAPWGVAQAPASFSGFGNDLLIGNFGSGAISAYNISTGAWIGNMLNVNDLPVQIDGLWGLTFGNGGSGGPVGTLYFTAGPFGETHGIFGSITPHPGM
ncbi:MAG: TIGR03118 family protein [Candidatus Korobacteraceae bacterium]|jgi:uncharacterized protein (TIGR03118 family)